MVLEIVGLLGREITGEHDGITSKVIIYKNPQTSELFYLKEQQILPITTQTYSSPKIRKISPSIAYSGTPHPHAIVIDSDIINLNHPVVKPLFDAAKENWLQHNGFYYHPISLEEYYHLLNSYAQALRPALIGKLLGEEMEGIKQLLTLYKAFSTDELEETLFELYYYKRLESPKDYNLTKLVLERTWNLTEQEAWRQIHNTIA